MTFFLLLLFIFMFVSMFRLFRGPTFHDRLISLNLVSVHIILILCFFSVLYEQSFFMDIAIIYALLSFSEIIAFLKLFKKEPQDKTAYTPQDINKP